MQSYDYLFINGEHTAPSSSDTVDLISPNDGASCDKAPLAVTADVDAAVTAARTAFDTGPFPRMSPKERAEIIRRLSAALQARGEKIAEVISDENGCPIQGSLGSQVFASTMVLDSFATMAETHDFAKERVGAFGQKVVVNEQPEGWFVPLTLFVDVDNNMEIAREEVFAPVLCVIPYADEDEAVRIANGTGRRCLES